jgi:MscS family membrane protein
MWQRKAVQAVSRSQESTICLWLTPEHLMIRPNRGMNVKKRTRTGYLLLAGILLLALLSAGHQAVSAQTPAPEPMPTALLDAVISATRTPVPTATPDLITEGVELVTEATGLAGESFLGLKVEDWINLVISILLVVIGYLVGTWLILSILRRLARRTETEFDDRFLEAVGSDVRWLVTIFTLNFATKRLTFFGAEAKALLTDVYFLLGLVVVVRMAMNLIGMADEEATKRAVQEGREDELAPVITLLMRVGRVLVIAIAVTIFLSRLGIDVTAFAAAIGLGGLAISLAAKDTIADAIAGFIILVDRPFRIGDRIEIQGVGTWGDVVDIGLRTTRIRTRDNRLVIVPNSTIGANQVVNYTYPDPRYRIQTHVGAAYGTDIEMVRRIIVETVRKVEGVLQEQPVDALYIEMGDSAMIFRVRWWIGSYEDTRRMFDRVHTALQQALNEAGIESPFPTQTLNVQLENSQRTLPEETT